jgi:hypothetical protein
VERPVPQASIEFEVGDVHAVQAAADELKGKGLVLRSRMIFGGDDGRGGDGGGLGSASTDLGSVVGSATMTVRGSGLNPVSPGRAAAGRPFLSV